MGISLGLVGLGSFGSAFAELFRGHPLVDTVALCDREPERVAQFAERPSFAAKLGGVYETLDALCERLGVVIPPALRHTALGDARATAEVLVRMLPMLKARGFETFGDVIAETRKHGRLLEDLN